MSGTRGAPLKTFGFECFTSRTVVVISLFEHLYFLLFFPCPLYSHFPLNLILFNISFKRPSKKEGPVGVS